MSMCVRCISFELLVGSDKTTNPHTGISERRAPIKGALVVYQPKLLICRRKNAEKMRRNSSFIAEADSRGFVAVFPTFRCFSGR